MIRVSLGTRGKPRWCRPDRGRRIDEKDVIDAQTLPKVKMPNAGNFINRFPERI